MTNPNENIIRSTSISTHHSGTSNKAPPAPASNEPTPNQPVEQHASDYQELKANSKKLKKPKQDNNIEVQSDKQAEGGPKKNDAKKKLKAEREKLRIQRQEERERKKQELELKKKEREEKKKEKEEEKKLKHQQEMMYRSAPPAAPDPMTTMMMMMLMMRGGGGGCSPGWYPPPPPCYPILQAPPIVFPPPAVIQQQRQPPQMTIGTPHLHSSNAPSNNRKNDRCGVKACSSGGRQDDSDSDSDIRPAANCLIHFEEADNNRDKRKSKKKAKNNREDSENQ